MTEDVVVARTTRVSKTFLRGSEMVHAVRDASLEILAGELVAIIGPSGSGKTTVLNLLAGWEEPESGSVHLSAWNRPLASAPWDRVGIVPQNLGLLGELSVRENVALTLRTGGIEGIELERVDHLLDELGLTQLGDRAPGEVSLGEQQRTAIARALVARPSLLLMDEPTGHQDARWTRGVFRTLRRACEEGTACLVATHNEEVLGFVDRILELRDGELTSSHYVAAQTENMVEN